jgi:hypothetical protein
MCPRVARRPDQPVEIAEIGGEMSARRVLIIANEAVADRPAGVPEVVRRQVLEADEVRVVAPMLTGRLQSWVSDIDAAALKADERMQAIVGSIGAAGHAATRGRIGDEDPLQGGRRRPCCLPRGCADPRRARARRRELARTTLQREGPRPLRPARHRDAPRPRRPRSLGHRRVKRVDREYGCRATPTIDRRE